MTTSSLWLLVKIEWLVREMEKEYELKYTIVGPEARLSKEVRVLTEVSVGHKTAFKMNAIAATRTLLWVSWAWKE